MTALTEQELVSISKLIKERYGINLEKKSSLVESRLGLYLESRGFSSYAEYFDFVCNDSTDNEMSDLINRLTTNHTYFMRESDHFEYLVDEIIPWVETLMSNRDLRIWCAGCSSGEEPYGLSIYLLDCLALREPAKSFDSVVLASDVSEKVLYEASTGIYSAENLAALSEKHLQKYFIPVDKDRYRVTQQLRANVAFRKTNLTEPFTVKAPFHAIFCRNVMIYFDNETKTGLVDRFHDSLIPGGYLLIGHSESLMTFKHRFDYVKPSIYRKPF